MRRTGFKELLVNRLVPLMEESVKTLSKQYFIVLDILWSALIQTLERVFNRSLPTTYYETTVFVAKQMGNHLCQKANPMPIRRVNDPASMIINEHNLFPFSGLQKTFVNNFFHFQ